VSNCPSPGSSPGLWHRIRQAVLGLGKRGRVASLASLGAIVVLVIALVGTTLLTSSPVKAKVNVKHHEGRTTNSTNPQMVATSTIPPPKLNRHLCPLTGQRSGDGKIPQRPAIGIKIGNDPAARPQSGLLYADIVYEEMAEGGITRYLAIFQCRQAAMLGPVRSVRWDDWHVLASYNHPILAYSGGINQWEHMAAILHWLYNADGTYYPMTNAYFRTGNRYPPENLYTSTARLWALDPKNHLPPPPQFQYRNKPAAGAARAAVVTIAGFSEGENVTWTWSAKAGAWMRSQGGVPDRDASGPQLHATNVVIQMVQTGREPYYESGTVYGVESFTEGTGTAYLLRNGRVEKGRWRTPKYGDTMQLRLANGNLMALDPGNTWVEMVPVGHYPIEIRK
jgi:hypothetical protein